MPKLTRVRRKNVPLTSGSKNTFAQQCHSSLAPSPCDVLKCLYLNIIYIISLHPLF